MKITIPVSVGELIDKITILEIKSMFSDNEYIQKELKELKQIKSTITQYTLEDEVKLKEVNQKLWKIEDRLREKEKLQEFVTQGNIKTVNYNGIIGVLIEAIKELKKEIGELKSTK